MVPAPLRLLAACALTLASCNKEHRKSTASGPTTAVQGSVSGQSPHLANAIYMWRDKADDMEVLLSDSPHLCETISAGARPAGSTVLMITLKMGAPDNQDGPFRAGDYPLHDGDARQYLKGAHLIALGPHCEPNTHAMASAGSVTLTTPQVATTGEAAGRFDLELGGSHLSGKFVASACPTPEEEPQGCK